MERLATARSTTSPRIPRLHRDVTNVATARVSINPVEKLSRETARRARYLISLLLNHRGAFKI
jgi:hypothetical protein